jgi:hypothetical protein
MRCIQYSFVVLCCMLCVLLTLIGCASQYSYFIVGSQEEQNRLNELFTLLDTYKKDSSYQERFVIINQISNLLNNSGNTHKQVLFLTTYVQNNPEDVYNGYYLALAAHTYELLGETMFAEYYYKKIFHNYPDLSFKNTFFSNIRKLKYRAFPTPIIM